MKQILTLLMVTVLASMAFAQDAPADKKQKKRKTVIERYTKVFSSVTMTEDQQSTFTAAKEKLSAQMEDLKTRGLTDELQKKRADLSAAGRESGLKGKELAAATMSKLSEDEKALFAEYQSANKAFGKSASSLLTEEQMSELPEKSKKALAALNKLRGGKSKKGEKGSEKKGGSKKDRSKKAEGEMEDE